MRHFLALTLAAALGGGCITSLDGTESSVKGQDKTEAADLSNCKIEGSLIGREGAVLEHGKRIVTFHDWVKKADSPGEYVGFQLTVEGSSTVKYIVKSGTKIFSSTAKTWLDPAGISGSSASAISHVTFCDCDCDCSAEGGGDGTGSGSGSGSGGPIIL